MISHIRRLAQRLTRTAEPAASPGTPPPPSSRRDERLPPAMLVGEHASDGPTDIVWRTMEAQKYSDEEIIALSDGARTAHGKGSSEYVRTLLQVGGLLMMKGSTSRAHAVEIYARARALVTHLDGESLLEARALDGMAAVKQAERDYTGAAEDLSAAIALWHRAVQGGAAVDSAYLARREADLADLERMIAFMSRRPPEPPVR